MEGGGWRLEDGGWRVEDGGWRLENGGWRMEGGGWTLEDGGWRLEGGGWRVEGGGWRAEDGGSALDLDQLCDSRRTHAVQVFLLFCPGRTVGLPPLQLKSAETFCRKVKRE